MTIVERSRRKDVLAQKAHRQGKDKQNSFFMFLDLRKGYDFVDRDLLTKGVRPLSSWQKQEEVVP